MAIQKSPHTQTQQNTVPEQTDLEANEQEYEADSPTEQELYEHMEGAETGMERNPREVEARSSIHNRTEPEVQAHEGTLSTRTPKRPVQGITSHSAAEESARQEKVVNDRPDAQAGVNRSKPTENRLKSGKKRG
jgi:hypothetical protein